MEGRYKNPCYRNQIPYALRTRRNDFAKVFGLCAEVEDDSRAACYRGLGANAARQSVADYINDAAQNKSTRMLCTLGGDHEARSNCLVGAVISYLYHYHKDAQAQALCESFEADLRAVCLGAADKYDEEEFDLDFVLD